MPYEEIVQWRAIMKAGIQKESGKTLRLFTIHALFPLSIFTEPLQEAWLKVKALCRKHGISDDTSYSWKAKYGGLEATHLKRLKKTESELAKLKRMYADLA